MYFKETDMNISTDGPGIVFYSPALCKDIPEWSDFLTEEFTSPADVGRHIRKGDITGFCTGSGGDFCLKFREGYPPNEIEKEYPVSVRLGIEIQDGKLCVKDLFWLSEWCAECPEEQILEIESGFYHITLNTKCPDSGIWGDEQTIYVHLNKLGSMPELTWNGVPYLYED